MTINDIYPLTLIKDRYNGVYSGGKWTAWPVCPDEIPDEAWEADDVGMAWFWDHWVNNICLVPVGRGDTPDEAIEDLRRRINGA